MDAVKSMNDTIVVEIDIDAPPERVGPHFVGERLLRRDDSVMEIRCKTRQAPSPASGRGLGWGHHEPSPLQKGTARGSQSHTRGAARLERQPTPTQ